MKVAEGIYFLVTGKVHSLEEMAKMTKTQMLCLIVAFSIVQFTAAAPVSDGHESNDVLDEIIMRLKQLKQNEGNEM